MGKQNQFASKGPNSLTGLQSSLARAHLATDQAESRFRLLVESVSEYGIFFLGPSGYIRSWNAGAERIKGYSADEAVGRHFSMFYTPEDIQRRHPEYELRVALAQGRYQEEGWRVRKDGTRFWANIVITALFDENGDHIGFAKVTRDLTERKRGEDELRAAYASLEQRVAERTKQLEETNEKLREAVEARDEFLSIASHELRSPITPLKLQVQMLIAQFLQKTVKPLPEDKAQKLASACNRALGRLESLIDNLLDVTRINSGRLILNLESVDLEEAVREVIERHRNEISDSHSTVTFHSAGPLIGQWDRLRIEQVIVNLLTNALKYGNKQPIDVELKSEAGRALLVFRDRGIGIDDEAQKKIFDRFERAESAAGISGLGLGLYITRQIVQAHGGSIHVESRPGGGSTFSADLPIVNG